MTADEFAQTFAGVVQGNRWILDKAYTAKPFADTWALRQSFQDALLAGSSAERAELMNSFPDLGSDVEGGTQPLEHAYGLDTMTEDDHGEVHRAAVTYRERYGFTWIVCARDISDYTKLADNAWSRIHNGEGVERAAAIVEIAKIFNHRFDDLIATANPIATARVPEAVGG
jgi:uric acid transporter